MVERPLLFSAPMVRALLNGTKTVTRRIVSPQPALIDGAWQVLYPWGEGGHGIYDTEAELLREYIPVVSRHCPHGTAGDRLWVREAWAGWFKHRGVERDWKDTPRAQRTQACSVRLAYQATDPTAARRWATSLFMPRWASRILLEVASVRIERLHAIDDADAAREGIRPWRLGGKRVRYAHVRAAGDPAYPWDDMADTAREAFKRLWTEINGTGFWESNPLVWRVEFKVLTAPREGGR